MVLHDLFKFVAKFRYFLLVVFGGLSVVQVLLHFVQDFMD